MRIKKYLFLQWYIVYKNFIDVSISIWDQMINYTIYKINIYINMFKTLGFAFIKYHIISTITNNGY